MNLSDVKNETISYEYEEGFVNNSVSSDSEMLDLEAEEKNQIKRIRELSQLSNNFINKQVKASTSNSEKKFEVHIRKLPEIIKSNIFEFRFLKREKQITPVADDFKFVKMDFSSRNESKNTPGSKINSYEKVDSDSSEQQRPHHNENVLKENESENVRKKFKRDNFTTNTNSEDVELKNKSNITKMDIKTEPIRQSNYLFYGFDDNKPSTSGLQRDPPGKMSPKYYCSDSSENEENNIDAINVLEKKYLVNNYVHNKNENKTKGMKKRQEELDLLFARRLHGVINRQHLKRQF